MSHKSVNEGRTGVWHKSGSISYFTIAMTVATCKRKIYWGLWIQTDYSP